MKNITESNTEADRVRERYLRETKKALASSDIRKMPFDRERLEAFATAVLRRVDDRYLKAHSGRNIVDQLTDSLRFVSARRPSDIAVRVFHPTVAENGYSIEGIIIETLMDDQPFIFDTLKLYLRHASFRLRNAMNVIISVDRDEDGALERIHPSLGSDRKESYCRLYIDATGGQFSQAAVETEIRRRLRKSSRAVGDFHRMKKHALDLSNEYTYLPSLRKFDGFGPFLAEAVDFLDWIVEDNFIFMGMSFFAPSKEGGGVVLVDALGIKQDEPEPCGQGTPEALAFFASERPVDKYFIRIRKSQEESLVHRSGMVDEVLVRRFDLDGNPAGGLVIHGLFTYKAISSAGGTIPILRRKLTELPQLEDAPPDSYLYKAAEDAFNSLPVEYLFNATSGEISRLIAMMLRADSDGAMSVHLGVEESLRSAYLFVVVPQKDYSDELREGIEALVKDQLHATYADHRAFIGKHGTVVLHFFLSGSADFRPVREDALSDDIIRLCSPWREQLRHQLQARYDEQDADDLYGRYADQFDEGYRATHDAVAAATDIENFERLGTERTQVIALRRPTKRRKERTETTQPIVDLVLYQRSNLYLTDVLPKLHHFGLRIIDQHAHNVELDDGCVYVVDAFRVDAQNIEALLLDDSARIVDALDAVFDGIMPSSPLNHLVIHAGLTWQQVEVLRAYSGYMRQLGGGGAADVVHKVLKDNPEAVRALVAHFEARFDPAVDPGADAPSAVRLARTKQTEAVFLEALNQISSFVEDRLLRGYFNLIEATLRTNAFRPDRPFHYLSFKFDCESVEAMQSPRPWREIYVHHINVEGVHLRGGPTARGGLRWSDRLDDYRSEVLGLMTTQMVKNTVIVPVGAKGGFVVHNAPSGDADVRRYADQMYRTFIRGLLDITDNRDGANIVPPPGVVRFDGEDSYLVVAADKGTAHLSDTANSISEEYGFWLGDAFASGGSNGYDHKAEGITAKGAWACTREHFREMGVDPEVDTIRVVGIGDMSGDVFGNGMLLSQTIQLVGAFNHRHIFIDPNPDVAASFAERQRLFALRGSSWRDYDSKVLSAGAAIYDRAAKSITLSPEAAAMFGLADPTLSPAELIRALLTLDVDLLWNGGIGTYVKSSQEAHRDAADKSNDDVRVDAAALRAKVVGEGGNLGMTKAARIEYALGGGRVNTDFVDNAGGVNLSDHEVNLKVLFAPLVQRGDMTMEQRNGVLRELAPQIVDAVVADNKLLSLRLSLDELRSRRDVFAFGRTTKQLERIGLLNRVQQHLPTRKRLIERAADNRGLTRPELAMVGAHAKMQVYQELVAAEPLPRRMSEQFLRAYFPDSIYGTYREAIESHLLEHEIVSTVATNLIVEYAGSTFFAELATDTERPIAEIAVAYIVASEILGAWELKRKLMNPALQLSAHAEQTATLAIEDVLRDVVVLFLHTLAPGEVWTWAAGDLSAHVEFNAKYTATLEQWLDAQLGAGRLDRIRAYRAHGLPQDLANDAARLPYGVAGLAAWSVAEQAGLDPHETLRAYVALASAFGISRLHSRILEFSSVDDWEVMATRAMRRSFFDHHAALTRAALQSAPSESGKAKGRWPINKWLSQNPELAKLAEQTAKAAEHEPTISALVVLSDRLTNALRMRS